MGDWDWAYEHGYEDMQGNLLKDDYEDEHVLDESNKTKATESIVVELTPSKYLDSDGRYIRAKLTNNDLNAKEINLEVFHDKSNERDPYALEVFCNRKFIGHIQKYNSYLNIDEFCFTESGVKRKLTIEWGKNHFILSRYLVDEPVSEFRKDGGIPLGSETWMEKIWSWENENADYACYADRESKKDPIFMFPRNSSELTSLTTIKNQNSFLTELPQEIGNLKNLTNIYISANLTSLPQEIGGLENLDELTLHFNKLSTLPAEIGNLKQLKTLILRDRELESLPKELGELVSLKSLQISCENLTEIPKEIGRLQNLELLKIYCCFNLSGLPEVIGNLSNLKSLDIGSNNLDYLPSEFCNLKNLEFLSICNNNLKDLPFGFENLQKLTTLSISGNKFSNQPEVINKLKNLKRIW